MEGQISPWMPEQDRIRLALLGKFIEECNEAAARAARCILQGINEEDPDTGRTNGEELAREIADIMACVRMMEYEPDIPDWSLDRMEMKISGFEHWHKLIEEAK